MSKGRAELRSYRESDEPDVVALWQRVFPNPPARNEPHALIRRKLDVQRELFLVAVDGGRIVGTAVAGFDGVRGWVHHVAVDPDRRRSGLGSRLMHAVQARLRDLGCPKLNLQINADNAVVVPFYESLGFRVEDRISMGRVLEGRDVER